MATVTKTFKENIYGSSYVSTWTFSITGSDVVASGPSVTLTSPTVTAKYVGANKGYANAGANIVVYLEGSYWLSECQYYVLDPYDDKLGSWASNAVKTITKRGSGHSVSVPTNQLFDSSNKTSKTVNFTFGESSSLWGDSAKNATATSNLNGFLGYASGTIGTITLDAPPTCSYTQVQSDTEGQFFKDKTNAYVDITNLSAKYGGDITECKLTIGNQSVTRTTNGRLSIKLNAVGTFTPVVSLKDSRGQTTTYNLSPITVKNIPIYAKHSGVWKLVMPMIKHLGVWKDCSGIYIKQNGTWKKIL